MIITNTVSICNQMALILPRSFARIWLGLNGIFSYSIWMSTTRSEKCNLQLWRTGSIL